MVKDWVAFVASSASHGVRLGTKHECIGSVHTGQPQLADYVTRPGERLFARLYTLDSLPVIYLAGQPEDFVDPQHMAKRLEPGDTAVAPPGLGTRACLDGPQAMPHIMGLVRQARELAGRMG